MNQNQKEMVKRIQKYMLDFSKFLIQSQFHFHTRLNLPFNFNLNKQTLLQVFIPTSNKNFLAFQSPTTQ